MIGEGSIGAPSAEAREEVRQRQRVATANRGGWPELPRKHLRFERFGRVVDERDNTTYRIHRGEAELSTKAIAAYFVGADQAITFLEPVPGGRR